MLASIFGASSFFIYDPAAICVTLCRDCFLCNKYLAANRALLTFGKTGSCTSRSLSRNYFFGMTCSRNLVGSVSIAANRASMCCVTLCYTSRIGYNVCIFVTFGLNSLDLHVRSVVLTSVSLDAVGCTSSRSCYLSAVPFVTVCGYILVCCVIASCASYVCFVACFCTSCSLAIMVNFIMTERCAACIATCITCLGSCTGCKNPNMLMFNWRPSSTTVIPCVFFYCVKLVSSKLKVSGLIPFIVPVVSSCTGIHTAEDDVSVSCRRFTLVYTVAICIFQ